MKIEMVKLDDGSIKTTMTGRIDEQEIVVSALENVYNESNPIRMARQFLRKRLNELKAR